MRIIQPSRGGGVSAIDIKLDAADQSYGFINLTEVSTLNVDVVHGSGAPEGVVYYVESGPVNTLAVTLPVGNTGPGLALWIDAGNSPGLALSFTHNFNGEYLYLDEWDGATFTQPTGNPWCHFTDCANLTTFTSSSSTYVNLAIHDSPLLTSVTFGTATIVSKFDCPGCALTTAVANAALALAVAMGAGNDSIFDVSGGTSGRPTMSGATAATLDVTFTTATTGDWFRFAGKTFYVTTAPGTHPGSEFVVDVSGASTPEDFAAAFSAVADANGFSVSVTDATLTLTRDVLGPWNAATQNASAFSFANEGDGSGNANLATLISRNWDVNYN